MALPRRRQLTLPTRPAAAFAVANAVAAAIALTISLAGPQAGGAPATQPAFGPVPAGTTTGAGSRGPAAEPSSVLARVGRHSASPTRVAAPAAPATLAADGIPAVALRAYRGAGRAEAARNPSCHLPWPLLAAIGRVESNHGRYAGAVLHADGVSTPAIIGVPLDGHGVALIRDTDHGRLDGDTVHDRAVGPMQFIPATWASWGRDADGDGRRDPFDLDDAAAAAADYLCSAGRDLAGYAGQDAAIRSYNHSSAYLTEVLGLERVYAASYGVSIPALPTRPGASRPAHVGAPTLPPVDPGPPRALVRPGRPAAASPGPTTRSTTAPAPSNRPSDPRSGTSTGSSGESSGGTPTDSATGTMSQDPTTDPTGATTSPSDPSSADSTGDS